MKMKNISENTCYIINVLQYVKIYCNTLRNIHIIQWSLTNYCAQICIIPEFVST